MGMLAVLQDKIATAGITNMRPLKLDLTQDGPPTERFDVIYSLMTFHHIPDTERILGELSALLSSPGYLCIADLDSEDGSFHGSDFSGHRGFDRATLALQAEQAGFRNPEFSTVFTIRKGTPEREYQVFLMIARKD